MIGWVLGLGLVGVAGYFVYKNYGGQVSSALGSAIKAGQLDALGLNDSGDGGG